MYLLIYFKGQNERESVCVTSSIHSVVHSSSDQRPMTMQGDQADAKGQELHLGLPHGGLLYPAS